MSIFSILTVLVPLWFIIISLVFFYLWKVLFSGFLQFKGSFVDDYMGLRGDTRVKGDDKARQRYHEIKREYKG